MKRAIAAGNASNVDTIFLQDSTSTSGGGLSGLAYNTSGLTCYYKRSNGNASIAVSLANITTLGTFVSGGFKVIDASHMAGAYEFHAPDAAFAAGATSVTFYFRGAANLVPRAVQYEIIGQAGGLAALGSQVDLIDAPNATAVSALQNGLATSAQAAAILSAFNSLNNLSKRMNVIVPATMVYEPSSPISYPCAVNVFDENGVLADLDDAAEPTLTVTNAGGTSRAANLSSITHPSVGNYRFTYTPATGDPQQEGLLFTSAGVENGDSLSGAASAAVSSIDYLSTLSAIEAQTNKIGTNAADGPNSVAAQSNAATAANQANTVANSALTTAHFNSVVGTPIASVSADIAAVKADTHATLQIEQGDEYIDGSTTPWNWVLMINGGGAPTPGGGANELLRKKLKTLTGGPITDPATVVGQKESA